MVPMRLSEGSENQSMRLLVLDDDEATGRLVSRIASVAGFAATATTTVVEFAAECETALPDVVVLDLQLGDADGVEQLRALASLHFSGSLILMSGFDKRVLATAGELARTFGLSVTGMLGKPVDIPEFRQVLAGIQARMAPLSAQRLSQAIQAGEMRLEYQPIVTRQERSLCKLEALVRWRHPELGLVEPDRFIPVAEGDPGVINVLTDWVIVTAIRDHAWMRSAGAAVPIAVNVSPRNLRDLAFPDRVGHLLKDAGMPPDQLCFEITETAAFHDAAETMDILTRIRLKGIQLAIDDFGIGYSSLKLLRQMPFSALKIDRTFVADLVTSRDSRAIVQCIVDLADNMEMQSIAEGVETEAIAVMLRDMGVDCLQGYLFARPMPVEQLPAWLAQSRFRAGTVAETGAAAPLDDAEEETTTRGEKLCASAEQSVAPSRNAADIPRLSRRQTDVMSLLGEGCSVKIMARRLDLGIGTVKTHLSQAYLALGVHNRIEALRRAGMMHALPERETGPVC